MAVIANETVRVSGLRQLVVKGEVYDETGEHAWLVKAHPGLFDAPDKAAEKARRPKSTRDLGEKSMSARHIERATQAPGEKRDVDLTCDECDFVAKSPAGKAKHVAKHDK